MNFNSLSYPFVYLDSSSILRANISPQLFKRKIAIKKPDKFIHLLDKALFFSNEENNYYKNIVRLIENNTISKIITYESINYNLNEDNSNHILLYGQKPFDIDGIITNASIGGWILWGEEVSHSNFYNAAMAIANSKCMVIDSLFLTLSTGKALMSYIPSKCFVVVLGKTVKNIDCDNIVALPVQPKDFIEELLSLLN